MNILLISCAEWPKSHVTEKRSNISVTARTNGLIFLPIIKTCSQFISIRIRLERTFVKYHYWLKQKNLTFLQIGKKNVWWINVDPFFFLIMFAQTFFTGWYFVGEKFISKSFIYCSQCSSWCPLMFEYKNPLFFCHASRNTWVRNKGYTLNIEQIRTRPSEKTQNKLQKLS